MSKKLLLVRHAKSDWDDPSIPDIQRPLNGRGKKDAPEMAKRLLKDKINIDCFYSSPAKRAKKTARIFATEYGLKKEDVQLVPDLYEASEDNFYDTIERAKDKFDTIAIFSHNPGITEFANELTNTRIDNIPTCGVFAVTIETKTWADFRKATKSFWFFKYPKESDGD